MISLTILIPWKDRDELGLTLNNNSHAFKRSRASVIVVNCGGDTSQLLSLTKKCDFPIEIVDIRGFEFNKSRALNIGINYARSEYVFNIDADVMITEDTMMTLMNSLRPGYMTTIERLEESSKICGIRHDRESAIRDIVTEETTRFVWTNGQETVVPNFRRYFSDGSRGGQGQLLVRKEDLTSIDGYNSELVGWGYEDIDILIRLQRLAGLSHLQMGEAIHLSHDDQRRCIYGVSKSVNNRRNATAAYKRYSIGQFRGTLSADLLATEHAVTIVKTQ